MNWFRSRYWILVSAVAMQACLGATYAWAVFVPSLRDLTGLGQGAAQVPFTLFYIVFPGTALFAGPILRWLGPRGSAVLGGIVFGAGWGLAGFGGSGFAFTAGGIGILGGIGVGIAYVVPIAVGVRWFPRRKGLVTGLAVAGFGGGAAAIGQVADFLMESGGMSPFAVFRVLGATYAILVGMAGLAMRWPDTEKSGERETSSSARESGKSPTEDVPSFRRVVSDRWFRVLYLAMVCGLMAGFAVNANLKHLSGLAATKAGVMAVSVFALANALGRIVWGGLFDRFRNPVRTIQANLLLQALVLISSPFLLNSGWGLQVLAGMAGFNYGGVLVLYASTVAVRWGAEKVGYIYGWMFSSNIFASLAPVLAGIGYDRWGSFTIPLITIALLEGGVLLLLQCLRGDGSTVVR